MTTAAPTTDQRRLGKIVNRNAALSRSITITSMKFAVICTTSCLSRDSRISTTTRVSDSAPDSAGRRNSAIQKKFRSPQDSRKPTRAAEVVFGLQHQADRRQMGGRDGKQPPETYRGKACGGDGGDWTWIWRGRHGRDATTTRHCL